MNYDSSPYRNSSNTGLSQLLAQQNKQMREVAESARIDRIAHDVADLRYRIERLDDRMYGPTFTSFEPEPSVETIDHTPSWFKQLWTGFITDPFWEFLKRPSIK